MLTIALLEAPLRVYQQSLSRKYGLSIENWYSWCADVAKQEIFWIVVLSAIAWGLFRMIRGNPSQWWFYTWLLASPLTVFLFFLSPILIDPLFNDFEPLDKSNPQLVDALEKVAKRGGLSIPRDHVFLMRTGNKVTTLNAYVTGLGSSKRVVVWDTTVQKATTDEISFVFAHEMAHYVLHHVFIQMLAMLVGAFVGLFLLFHASGWTVRTLPRWHIRSLDDMAVLPIFLIIIYVLGFLAQPISNALSRQLEHNADIYGLEITHGINADSQQSAAAAFQAMGELSLAYPSPDRWIVFWYFDHPPIPDRVRFAVQYAPWSKGQIPRYVSRM
jgi:Zn-dependent protease with chaperone function